MSNAIKNDIITAEEKLRAAMLNSDIDTLDALLSSNLVFTNHLGHVITKEADLEAHRSGLLDIKLLRPSEERIQILDNIAVVSVRVQIVGSYAGVSSENDFRFTRVWSRSPSGCWQIVAGHSCIISWSQIIKWGFGLLVFIESSLLKVYFLSSGAKKAPPARMIQLVSTSPSRP